MSEALKQKLAKRIDAHFRNAESFFKMVESAANIASKDNIGLRIEVLEGKIKQLEQELRKNVSLQSFFIDLGISLLLGPIAGHLLEHGLRKMCGAVIANRNLTVKTLSALETKAPQNLTNRDWLQDLVDDASSPQMRKTFSARLEEANKELEADLKLFNSKTAQANWVHKLENLTPVINDVLQQANPQIWSRLTNSTPGLTPPQNPAALQNQQSGIIYSNPLAFFTSTQEKYLTLQRAVNEHSHRFHVDFLLEIDDDDVRKRLIENLESYADFPSNGDERFALITDLAFMYRCLLFILTYGDPKNWGYASVKSGLLNKDVYSTKVLDTRMRGGRVGAMDNYESIIDYEFDYIILLPKEAKEFLFNMKGTKILDGLSFMEKFGAQKRAALGNPLNPYAYGINNKPTYSESDGRMNGPRVPQKPVSHPASIDYTVDEYVFEKTRQWFAELYVQMSQSNLSFEQITQNAKKP